MTERDFAALWERWSLAIPCIIAPLMGGTNSQVWRVTDARGAAFVLRLLPDVARLPRYRTEIALLRQLHALGVPFAVPIPIATRDGEDLVHVDDHNWVTLTPFLAGDDPDCANPTHAASAGHTLAVLDVALARLSLPPDAQFAPAYGDFAAWHPLVADPLAAVARLPVAPDQQARIRQFLAAVLARVPALYAALPQGIVHRDYSPGNFLFTDGQATAILDFEYVGPDLRALDLVVALSWWHVPMMRDGAIWPLFAAFARAYLADFPLTEAELMALPDLWRLRDATSFVHRMGRYLAGQETEARMQARVAHSLWREAWIAEHGERLVSEARQWGNH